VKLGGGHAGHNGIRSISSHIGQDFRRVRIGIGHPGDKKKVHGYVLSSFLRAEQIWVQNTIDAIAEALPILINGDDVGFMTKVAYLAPSLVIDQKGMS
jgi:PTH1 family peptidyl-tRNA hydrolase